jgi:hypothetical protein
VPEPTPENLDAHAIRVSFDLTYGDEPCSFGMWLESSDVAPSGAECADAAQSIAALFDAPSFLGNLSSSLTHQSTKVTQYDGSGGAVEGIYTSAQPGLIGGDAMPANTAMVVSVHGSAHYRGGKGRMYIPGEVNAAAESVKQWSDDFVGTMNSAVADFLAAVNALTPTGFTTLTVGTWHRWLGGVAIAPSFDACTGMSIQPRICTQRRRLGSTL